MKNNHEKLLMSIAEAINACGYDGVFEGAKLHLRQALDIVKKVAVKRGRRKQDEMREIAVNKHKQWWNTIKENVAKPITEELPDLPPPEYTEPQ